MKKKANKKVILVVEDDPILLRALSDSLSTKYKVLKAENGKEGLKTALKEHPDLIVMDLMMPVMDGMTAISELRKDEWGKDIFVFILTNKKPTDEVLNEASRTPYVSEYLIKSASSLDEIMDKIKTQLKRRAS